MHRSTRSIRSLRLLPSIAALALIGCASAAPSSPTPAKVEPVAQVSSTATVQLALPPEHAYTKDFFPGTTYDAAISTPDAVLGFRLGERPAQHTQVIACWRAWARESKRAQLSTYAHSHEGRELVYGVVTSERNLANLDAILDRVARLADPRRLGPAESESIVAQTPAIAWLGFSIHGDEMSGVDGGLALAHHLIAGTSQDVTRILDEVVVVIDPMQNPDGRERFLAMLLANAGSTPVLDGEAMSHGRWPGGRGNHYLFDMNRDWLSGIAPETRGRWKVVQRFHPQLFVDAHEMGRDDSYLFYPQADPINPHLPRKLVAWQKRYGADIASAFDVHGWSYYTREWADGWGPFYSDSWGSLNGAIGILYEQARYNGQTVRLASGEIATYREAAHRQATASLANVTTLALHRREALTDYAQQRCFDTFGVDELSQRGNPPQKPLFERPHFVVRPGANWARAAWLWATLSEQGIELDVFDGASLEDVVARDGETLATLKLEGPLWSISALQPQGALVRAFLEFDTRYPKADLERERKALELKNESKIYDTTAWNFTHALGLEAWRCAKIEGTRTSKPPPAPVTGVIAPQDSNAPVYGWIVDGADDGSMTFAARALQLGLQVNVADEAFESAGRGFARGSLLVRGHENQSEAAQRVHEIALLARVAAFATTSARAPAEGHDLGGQHFHLLERPRVAMLSNAPVSNQAFGHLWHFVDRELGLPVSLLDAQQLGQYDLRRYNVIILPPSSGLNAVLEPAAESLKSWVRGGGTLIATGGSAGALARESLGLSEVRERGDVLEKLEEMLFLARREREAGRIEIDERAVWEGVPSTPEGKVDTDTAGAANKAADGAATASVPTVDPDKKRAEEWRRRFSPQGVFLRGEVRVDHWLTGGSEREMPLFFDGSLSLWPSSPSAAVVRFAPSERLRLSGLLWPEARERLAQSAYLTVERAGHGQVILFAAQPAFRGYHKTTARLFANAIVLGPGVGAEPPRDR